MEVTLKQSARTSSYLSTYSVLLTIRLNYQKPDLSQLVYLSIIFQPPVSYQGKLAISSYYRLQSLGLTRNRRIDLMVS